MSRITGRACSKKSRGIATHGFEESGFFGVFMPASQYPGSFIRIHCKKRRRGSRAGHSDGRLSINLEVSEARDLFHEVQRDGAGRTVTMLSDVNLGDTSVLGFGIVNFVSIDKHDYIGILLD